MGEARSGWKKVYEIYPAKNFWKGMWKPLILLFVSFIAFCFRGEVSTLELIKQICSLITSGFPSIIGFILTGYALIIGFSGSDFLLKMVKSKADDNHSLFERVNATFAVLIGFLIVTYVLADLAAYILSLSIEWPLDRGYETFNAAALFTLLFFFYYSIFALIDIVMNVFNLGQLAHAVAKSRLKAIEDASNDGQTDKTETSHKSLFCRILCEILNPSD